jgi:hypothetical protein
MYKRRFPFKEELGIREKDVRCVKIVDCPNNHFNHAFINYVSRECAELAVFRMDGCYVDGSQVRVRLHSKSPDATKCKMTVSYTDCHDFVNPVMLPRSPVHHRQPESRSVSPFPKHGHLPHAHASTTESCTVKLSFFGRLNPADIKRAFYRFGRIQGRLIVRGKDPCHVFITFSSCKEAADACCHYPPTLNLIPISVENCQKPMDPERLASKEVLCSALAASILRTEKKGELEKLEREHRVKVTFRPSSNCFSFTGKEQQVNNMELCLNTLVRTILEKYFDKGV